MVSFLTLDCNDTIATINPSVLEIPNNNIDDNCDGEIDEISSTSEEKKSRVLLFPNPTNDIVHLISDEEIFKIQIISLAL
ncbi:MAG: putative metal-binding motif-containing protein [Saprospiraceae bacterium]|nr:putative metal-binding motif-containing protein [Saprospiraceae bacterium]